MGKKRKIYEVYDGDKLLWKGNATYVSYNLNVSEKQIWWYVSQQKRFKHIYEIRYVGLEEDRPKKEEPKEEYDHITCLLNRYNNVCVSEKEYAKNIDRLKEIYGNVKETKILNNDGFEKRQRKKTYHYVLEVGI